MEFEITVEPGSGKIEEMAADFLRPRAYSASQAMVSNEINSADIHTGTGDFIRMGELQAENTPVSPTRRLSEGCMINHATFSAPAVMSLCDGRSDGRYARMVSSKEHLYGSCGSFGSTDDVGSVSRKAYVRAVVQQCTGAQLKAQPASTESSEELEINKGIIVYICFLKGAKKADVEEMARVLLSARICEADDSKLVSILELPGDVLIIPQPTLGGRVKGKVMVYNKNITKDEGQRLYTEFVTLFKKAFEKSAKCLTGKKVVRHGTYGTRQAFSCQTNGPDTHLIEI